MGSVEEHLGGNAMLIVSLRHLWSSPRGTVLRIEALALVAIILSFFLAFFGSCRRWSNRWIVQKGFLAAQVLSLSLGTYSIGLMQSSQVKSEMYPIWSVSLLTLFGCIDPVTTYIELDYKGLLSKVIFQLCLYFGYVILMSVSTISSHIGKLAIVLLSTITFIKGFHRALAFVLPGQIRDDITQGRHEAIELYALKGGDGRLIVHLTHSITMADIKELRLPEGTTANGMMMEDMCLSYSFSHLLRKRFIGLDTTREMKEKLREFKEWKRYCAYSTIDCKQALKVVEVELAFLFEAFFTSNEFLHLYQAKICSFWALVSFIGICFVGVVVAIIPGGMANHHTPAGTSCAINIVDTTTADLIVTLVILVSMALLQLVQLIRCRTSNWARVQIACKYASKEKKQMQPDQGQSIVEVTGGDRPNDNPQSGHGEELCSSSNTRSKSNQLSRWMRWLRLFLVARVNWFDKYLWQVRLGQHSVDALLKRRIRTQYCRGSVLQKHRTLQKKDWLGLCLHWLSVIGVQYFWRLVNVLLLSDTTNSEGAISLDDDVKASIAEFLGTIRNRRIGVEWLAWLPDNGLQCWFPILLPYTYGDWIKRTSSLKNESEASFFTRNVIIWHIATCYCKKAEKEAGSDRGGRGEYSSSSNREKNRRVAMDLSKYCLYLLVSAPELLPGPATLTKQALDNALDDIQDIRTCGEYVGKLLRNEAATMPLTFPFPTSPSTQRSNEEEWEQSTRRPCTTDPWKLLALLWAQTLLYAAPYGDVQAHMLHLAQGGEFITHLWALLYHLGIDRWKLEDMDKLKAMMEQAAEATWEVQVEEDAFSGSEIEEIN